MRARRRTPLQLSNSVGNPSFHTRLTTPAAACFCTAGVDLQYRTLARCFRWSVLGIKGNVPILDQQFKDDRGPTAAPPPAPPPPALGFPPTPPAALAPPPAPLGAPPPGSGAVPTFTYLLAAPLVNISGGGSDVPARLRALLQAQPQQAQPPPQPLPKGGEGAAVAGEDEEEDEGRRTADSQVNSGRAQAEAFRLGV